MTREELWEAYTTRNPQFAKKGNVTLSTDGLKRLFEQTWDLAYNEGGKLARGAFSRHSDGDPKPYGGDNDPMGVFRDIFNRKS